VEVFDVEVFDVEVFDVASNRLTGPLPLMEGWGQVSSLLLHSNLRQHRPQPRDARGAGSPQAVFACSLCRQSLQPRSLCSHAAFAASLCSGHSRQPLPVVPGQARREPGRQSLQAVFAGSLCRQSLQAVFAASQAAFACSLCSLCSHCSRCSQPLQPAFAVVVLGSRCQWWASRDKLVGNRGVELRRGVTAWSFSARSGRRRRFGCL
jgi:hypothetical protein